MQKFTATIASVLALSGCVTTNRPAGKAVALEDLVRQIKSDVGQYNAYAAEHAKDAPQNNVCGGKIDLTISSVGVSVTTVTKRSSGSTLGAEVAPVAFVKVGVSGGVSQSLENSQVLSFTLVPVSSQDSASEVMQPSQLFLTLKNLRESLLKSSDKTPCFRFPQKDQDNSVEFGFVATDSTNLGGGVNLFFFSFGVSRNNEYSAANKITIKFTGEGQAIQ